MRSVIAATVVASALVSSSALAATPVGYLDSAGCDVIVGWAQDPDAPDAPVTVHIYYGGPAGSGAGASPTTANVYRTDLCTAIGSCAHGYSPISPLSLHDGQTRDIYAYAIDDGGTGNPLLGNSPRQMTCAPEAQTGVRRRVADLPSYDAWRFSSFWDLLPLAATDVAALPEGPPLAAAPVLVSPDDDSGALWLLDGDGRIRRQVAPEVVASWKFDLASVQKFPASQIAALVEGTPLRARPVTFVSGPLYVVDDVQPDPGNGPSLTASAGSGEGGAAYGDGGSGGAPASAPPLADDPSEGGGCQTSASSSAMGGVLGFCSVALALGAAARLRRPRRSR